MTTRSLDKTLSALTVSPAPGHLEIIGKKLLTCEQVRLYLLAHKKYSASSILHEAPSVVAEQVIKHFEKANIKIFFETLDLQGNESPAPGHL